MAVEITEADRQVLDRTSKQRLAEMACLLNTWLWPLELPDPEEPDHSPITKTSSPSNLRRRALRVEIERRVGLGATMEEWNRKEGRRRVYRKPIDRKLNFTGDNTAL